MAITITQGDRQTNASWQSIATFTGSTATTPQVIPADVDIVALGMGTATGDNSNNLYDLNATTTASGRSGDAVEGQEIYLHATATGEAAVFIAMPTQGRLPLQLLDQSNLGATGDIVMVSATARWVFAVAGDFMYLKFMNNAWNYMAGAGPTQATAT